MGTVMLYGMLQNLKIQGPLGKVILISQYFDLVKFLKIPLGCRL